MQVSALARFGRYLLGVLPAILILAFGVVTEIDLPGIYLDGANPDFYVVPILNPDVQKLTGWTLPGNLIADRFPVLSQVYHGTLPVYVGLPFYALFGTGAVGIHATHGVFAGIALISFYVLLISFRLETWLAGLIAAALALDSAFVFSFRNQFYVTVFPIAFVFLSAAAVNWAARTTETSRAARRLILSGALTGIACFGYFVHLFLGAVIFIFLIAPSAFPLSRSRRAAFWLIGLVVGLLPFIIGFGLAAWELGSVIAAAKFFLHRIASLQIGRPSEGLADRLRWAVDLLNWAISNVGNESMMFGRFLPRQGENWRLLILLGLPLVTLLITEILGRGDRLLRLAAGFVLANFIMCLCFGTRVWVQHTAPMVPVFYLGLAGALAVIVGAGSVVLPRAFAIASIGVLLYLNAAGQSAVFAELRRTGGVGFMSDAINRFAEDAIPRASESVYMLPEIGLQQQTLMITRGRATLISHEDVGLLHRRFCEGKDVAIAYLPKADDDRARRWIKDFNEGEPEQTVYSERTGREVIGVLRWLRSAHRALNCP
ncbi:MAG: hypothetical protein ACREC7_00470 [Methyloceanibacter sp.]